MPYLFYNNTTNIGFLAQKRIFLQIIVIFFAKMFGGNKIWRIFALAKQKLLFIINL
jgi:hypothetical protein